MEGDFIIFLDMSRQRHGYLGILGSLGNLLVAFCGIFVLWHIIGGTFWSKWEDRRNLIVLKTSTSFTHNNLSRFFSLSFVFVIFSSHYYSRPSIFLPQLHDFYGHGRRVRSRVYASISSFFSSTRIRNEGIHAKGFKHKAFIIRILRSEAVPRIRKRRLSVRSATKYMLCRGQVRHKS